MKSEILLPTYSRRCAVTCVSNPICSPCCPANCQELLPTHKMVLDLTCQPMECGGGRSEKTFFDVRVFNPHAPSNKSLAPPACYRKHEREKKRAYEQRVREVEHSTFTPLVFSATGGMASEATNFYKHLASMLALKWDSPYSSTLCWLRCRLSFSLLRSAIQAIRGARSSRGHAIKPPTAVDLVTAESRLSSDL